MKIKRMPMVGDNGMAKLTADIEVAYCKDNN